MGRHHHWDYADTAGQRVGLMVCTACGRSIDSGQYRYRETEDAYLPQHRACSAQDPHWGLLDKRAADRSSKLAEIQADANAYASKWSGPYFNAARAIIADAMLAERAKAGAE